MGAEAPAARGSRLHQIARRPRHPAPGAGIESCEMCGEPLPVAHRHLLEVGVEGTQQVLCACPACTLLFDHHAAGAGHYRLIPQRRVPLPDFRMDEPLWAALGVPVDMAFFVAQQDGSVTARYPSPLGTVRAGVAAETWQRVAELNPPLREMDSDVEALLVRRSREARDHWLVGVDDCYRLAARVRASWTGISGGSTVWRQIDAFFGELRGEAPRREEEPWPSPGSASRT
jgi:hypothetical protein